MTFAMRFGFDESDKHLVCAGIVAMTVQTSTVEVHVIGRVGSGRRWSTAPCASPG